MKDIDFLTLFKNYKWYIIGYAIWVCFFSFVAPNMWNWSKKMWWSYWGTWCIMIPLVAYCIISAIKHFTNK